MNVLDLKYPQYDFINPKPHKAPRNRAPITKRVIGAVCFICSGIFIVSSMIVVANLLVVAFFLLIGATQLATIGFSMMWLWVVVIMASSALGVSLCSIFKPFQGSPM